MPLMIAFSAFQRTSPNDSHDEFLDKLDNGDKLEFLDNVKKDDNRQ